MMSCRNLLSIIIVSLISPSVNAQKKTLAISSPNGSITINITLKDKIYYAANFKAKAIINPSAISLQLMEGNAIGANPVLKSAKSVSVNKELNNVVNGRRSSIKDVYNELTVQFKNNYAVIFRVYDEGFAYRFVTNLPGKLIIKNEEASFNFVNDHNLYYIPKVRYENDGEGKYNYQKMSEMPDSVYGLTPIVVDIPLGPKVAITESALFDYPGLNIKTNPALSGSLIGSFAPEVEDEIPNGWVYKILKRKNFIAETSGQRDFPWRVIVVAENDAQLADCDLVYKLAKPATPETDVSWIKHGKAAWDWWADWSIAGVNFKGEPESFEYYKYLIDFAASHKLEFVEISVGWMNDQDILNVSSKIRMPELMQYAKQKNIGIMVWVVAQTLERQFAEAFNLFTTLGVAGIKVDFFNADHQSRINFYERIARECMKTQLMVYYHGACKPTGLERTYPCIINYEGVQANEYNKWSKDETSAHAVNVGFIRNLAGPMDMNCGAMRNGQGDAFAISNSYPMSQGTRCNQLAMYITYYAPFEMVSDAPNEYINDKKCIEFISAVPTNWTDSKPIEGKIGEYLIMARKSNNDWFIGGLNNETERKGEIKLDFLGTGKYKATIFQDGVNANKVGTDYEIKMQEVTQGMVLPYHMAKGGGFAIRVALIN